MERVQADACVVGAGFAGLTAAWRLAQAGRAVVVVEARDRIGGRVWTDHLADGTPIDRGGAWLGPGQDRLYALAAEMGAGTYPTYVAGDHLFLRDGRVHRYRGLIPRGLSWSALVQLELARRRIDALARRVPLDAPWSAPGAAAMDARTIESWIRWNVASPTVRDLLRMTMTELFTSDTAEVSLLHMLFHLHSAGGFVRQTSIEGGTQQDRIVDGMQTIVDRLAARLGGAVRLSTPVREIRQDAAGVEVVSDRVTVRAARAIVAVPPVLASHIRWTPRLPTDRGMLLERLPAGWAWKFALVYDDAFWRSDGLSGQTLAMGSPFVITLDACGEHAPPGILNTFVVGPHARALAHLDTAERRQTVVAAMAARFGPKASRVRDFVEQEWAAEEWTRGCFMSRYAPGIMTQFGHLVREPVGLVHFAGTETSPVMNGFIDGAVRSGERAAAEVLESERRPRAVLTA